MDLNTITGNIYHKTSFLKISVGVANTYTNLFRINAAPVSGAFAPFITGGGDRICTNGSIGAIPITFEDNTQNTYIARVEASTSVAGSLILYDRLWHAGGITLNATTGVVAITGSSLPARDMYGTSSGYGLEIWGDFQAAAVTVNSSWLVGYIDATGLPCQAVYRKTTAPAIQTMVPFWRQSGDGVSGIVSFQCTSTGGAPNSLALVVLRRIAEIPLGRPNTSFVYDPLALGFPRLYSGTCLAGMTFGAAAGVMMGNIYFTRGV